MGWIKRNLALVISALIALGLLGFGGYYLWSAIQKNAGIDTSIGQAKSEIERLLNKPITPSQTNLDIARQEATRLAGFIQQARKHFPPTPPPSEPLNALSFKSMLENTVTELHRQAGIIKVPTNALGPYYFTFENQRLPVTFPQESLYPLYERLQEVKLIAEMLFKSRINELEDMRRAMVPGEVATPPGGGGGGGGIGNAPSSYVNSPPATNAETGMVMWPYEVTFQCFSPELATVLEALQGSKYGILVKSVQCGPAVETRRAQGQPPPLPPGGRSNVIAPPLSTIITERPLRVTLRLDVIKPEPVGNRPPRP